MTSLVFIEDHDTGDEDAVEPTLRTLVVTSQRIDLSKLKKADPAPPGCRPFAYPTRVE